MQVRFGWFALLTIVACVLGLCGCFQSHSAVDEEKESHFLAGKARANELDYQGALDCFEKAIEANPRSAPAHFEAGLLCEKYKQDHAAAIYHFNRFLELRPDSGYAQVVKMHILACKQELARNVLLSPITQSLQKEFEQLSQENKTLREEVEGWRAKARAQAGTIASTSAVPSNASSSASSPGIRLRASGSSTSSTVVSNTFASLRSAPAAPSSGRTHTVKSGETPMAIARKYGVKLDMLLAANPKLDPRRLHVGQSVIVPLQ